MIAFTAGLLVSVSLVVPFIYLGARLGFGSSLSRHLSIISTSPRLVGSPVHPSGRFSAIAALPDERGEAAAYSRAR